LKVFCWLPQITQISQKNTNTILGGVKKVGQQNAQFSTQMHSHFFLAAFSNYLLDTFIEN